VPCGWWGEAAVPIFALEAPEMLQHWDRPRCPQPRVVIGLGTGATGEAVA
jgi:hypothetical protein